jgi:uncharacterized protein (TIGR03435 family)
MRARLISKLAIAIIVVLVASWQITTGKSQTPRTPASPQWQMDAGGKMEFEAASVDNHPLEVDRPILDRTGLSGTFDFSLEWTPESNGAPHTNFEPDPTGPTFKEALQEQLGLKLEPITGPVDVFAVDHIEEPLPN